MIPGNVPNPARFPAGCRFHPRCPVAFERCGWTAEEVVADLKGLVAGQPTESLFAGARPDGPLAFVLPGAPTGVESTLRDLVAHRAEEIRALKAITAIERSDGGVRVSLHDFTEPDLKSITADTQVSCHLFA